MALSLTRTVVGQLRANEIHLVRGVRSLCPVRTGALRASVKMSVLERHGGIVLRLSMNDYFRYVSAKGIPGRNLVRAVAPLMLKQLRNAAQLGVAIYLRQVLGQWGLPTQNAFHSQAALVLSLEFRLYTINKGRV